MLEWSLIRKSLGQLEDKLFHFRTLIIISLPKIDAECDKLSGASGSGVVPDQSCREGKFDGSKHKVLSLEIFSQSKNSIFIFSTDLFSGRKRWNKQRNIKIFSSVFSAFSSILSWRPFDILNSIQQRAATIIYSFNDFFYRGLFLTVKKWENDTPCPRWHT